MLMLTGDEGGVSGLAAKLTGTSGRLFAPVQDFSDSVQN